MADITIGNSEGRGRGVFAARRFEAGETIEVCPLIALSETDARTLDSTGLYDYYFGWGNEGKAAAIALATAPCTTNRHHRMRCIRSMYPKAPCPSSPCIERGEEIFIRYDTGTGGNTQQMWLEIR